MNKLIGRVRGFINEPFYSRKCIGELRRSEPDNKYLPTIKQG